MQSFNIQSKQARVTNIAAILQEQACTQPDAAAIIDRVHGRDRVTTFGELERQVAQAASLLWEAGLRPGDEVLVFQPMSAELYVALIALFRSGLVAMFLDPSVGLEHIEQCCQLVPPKAFIGSVRAHLLRLISPALRHIPHKFVIGGRLPGAIPWSRAERLAPRADIYHVAADTPALLTFTSGSTGRPKAAVRSHGFLLEQHRVLEQHFPGQPGAVSLTTMPIFVLVDLASGVTSLIAAGDLRKPGSIDPAPVVAQIERYRPTRATASPAFWERITAYCRTQHPHSIQLPHLRAIYAGGAPVFPRLLTALHAIAPQAQIVAVYGSTEAEPIAHISYQQIVGDDYAAMLDGKGLLVGEPVPEIALRILHTQWGKPLAPCTQASFDAACLPANMPGEIVVSGAHVLSSYLHGQGNEETKFQVDGATWHRTGDMGYLDERGRLWLLGRCAARIQDRRGTLYPFAVETAVSFQEAIRLSALASYDQQRILALELDKRHPTPDLEALRQSIAWAGLDTIRIYDHLPVDKRHNAKIDYPALRRMVEQSIK